MVRDRYGKPVATVPPDKLAVYEDGVRQNIASFRLVKGNEVRAEDEKEAAEALGKPVKDPAALNPLRIVNVVCPVFNDLSPETRAAAFQAAEKFVNNEIRRNDLYRRIYARSHGHPSADFPDNRRDASLHGIKLAAVNQLPYAAVPSPGFQVHGAAPAKHDACPTGDAPPGSLHCRNGRGGLGK